MIDEWNAGWRAASEQGEPRVRELEAKVQQLTAALEAPLRETIVAVLENMPADAAPEHLAAQIETQVRGWQTLTASRAAQTDQQGRGQ